MWNLSNLKKIAKIMSGFLSQMMVVPILIAPHANTAGCQNVVKRWREQ